MLDPVDYNFNIYVGQTLKYPFTVWEDEAQAIAYDFTDHSVASQARLSFESAKAISLNATIEGNTIFLNATPEQLSKFVISANNKSAKYYYDIEITKPDSIKWTIVRGTIEVFPEVTKI